MMPYKATSLTGESVEDYYLMKPQLTFSLKLQALWMCDVAQHGGKGYQAHCMARCHKETGPLSPHQYDNPKFQTVL